MATNGLSCHFVEFPLTFSIKRILNKVTLEYRPVPDYTYKHARVIQITEHEKLHIQKETIMNTIKFKTTFEPHKRTNNIMRLSSTILKVNKDFYR